MFDFQTWVMVTVVYFVGVWGGYRIGKEAKKSKEEVSVRIS